MFCDTVGVDAFSLTCGWMTAPAVAVISAAFGEDAEEADLAVEHAADVGGGYVGVVP